MTALKGNPGTIEGDLYQVNALALCKESQAFAVRAVTALVEAFST